MSKTLFNDFESVSSKAWKQKIQVDLKGADYNDALIWNTNDGIDVKPFYHQDEFNSLPEVSSTKASQWKICQSIYVLNEKHSNKTAIDAINRGAEQIEFAIPTADISIEKLLKDITVPIILKTEFISESFIKSCLAFSKNPDIYIYSDIIGNLARTGNWYKNLKEDHAALEAIVKLSNQISIDASLYQNSGSNIVQQLAYALVHCNEYFNYFNELISSEAKSSLNVTYKVSVGTNYFFEIAKLKALRLLHNTLAKEYNFNTHCNIIATPTKRNKTLYDYNTNMLRTTTECMSAILGGANSVNNLAYDSIYHKDNEFGSRIARNQLLILKHESYFDKVNNPSDGSYYIETLTTELATKALELFKDVESNGGFLKQLKEGIIQRKIKESAQKEQEQFNNQEIILLGTNKHANSQDKMKDNLELYPFIKMHKRKTLIQPIIEKRLAETIEQERLKTE
jgi:methylmalonyl-CoA mutase